jgi:thiol-disulfide isomerase/thioredoxin
VRGPALAWGAVMAGVVALLVGWGRPFDRSNTTQKSPYTRMEVVRYKGEPAPDFALPTIEGQTVTLSALRGQAVFLNFWATWCPPCREEMPSVERLHQSSGSGSRHPGIRRGRKPQARLQVRRTSA